MFIDLHTHSDISDGTLSPEALVDAALVAGVELLALCDHDTTGDLRFLRYAAKKGLRALQGIELSAEWKSEGSCHIVGLGVVQYSDPMDSILEEVVHGRELRNKKILEKLEALGCPISQEELVKKAGGDVVGRPHLAALMKEKGYVATVQEAFDRYLAKGGAAYCERFRLEPEIAIDAILHAEGKPVIAHPSQLAISFEELDRYLGKWKQAGLWGIEVYTPYTPVDQYSDYLALAKKHELAVTGGSDFHGETKKNHFLGELRNGVRIADTLDGFCDLEIF